MDSLLKNDFIQFFLLLAILSFYKVSIFEFLSLISRSSFSCKLIWTVSKIITALDCDGCRKIATSVIYFNWPYSVVCVILASLVLCRWMDKIVLLAYRGFLLLLLSRSCENGSQSSHVAVMARPCDGHMVW